mgnify:FL=1
MSVVQLTNKSGLSPQMNQAFDTFHDQVEEAIDAAADASVPLELIIGAMVCSILAAFMRSEEEE